jgi:hypothetical protein
VSVPNCGGMSRRGVPSCGRSRVSVPGHSRCGSLLRLLEHVCWGSGGLFASL